MSFILILIGIGLIGGGIFVLSLVAQAPTDEVGWLQTIINAGEEAGGWAGGLMIIAGIFAFILGLLNLAHIIRL